MHMNYKIAILAIAAGVSANSASAATVFTDGTFDPSNYTTSFVYQSGATGTSSFCASCGNPGSALVFTISEPAGTGYAFIGTFNSTFVYDPASQGAISSIAASVDKNFSVSAGIYNNSFRPLIEQDGKFYTAFKFFTPVAGPATTGFLTLSIPTLTASDFGLISALDGTANFSQNPDFAGDPIEFGIGQYLAASGQPNTVATYTFDNLNIAVSAVPEPSTWGMMILGFAGMTLMSFRRKARLAVTGA